ncbi:MAG: hypothetical protein K0S98_1718 [Propionibacteriaceae bacterium]|jgi:hypothetical protein|nr:hypothetical protein [Propionibacteriaceae bacterium]
MPFLPGSLASIGVDRDADGRAEFQLAKRVPKQPLSSLKWVVAWGVRSVAGWSSEVD